LISKKIPKENKAGRIPLPPLIPGVLVKRYKRFLADVRLETGEIVTAHCPNSGSMKACADPGRPVYLSRATNPKRKLAYTWELIRMPDSLVGVNTLLPNRLVRKAIACGQIEPLRGYPEIKREVGIGGRSRIDLMLSGGDLPRCYVEVKNCTWVQGGLARFPDAVTERGRKHMAALQDLVAQGFRAAVFFLIQRMDAKTFRPARELDPAYADALGNAAAAGVKVLAYDVDLTLEYIEIRQPVTVRI
jgi:sugar fermentation stimulation protein A